MLHGSRETITSASALTGTELEINPRFARVSDFPTQTFWEPVAYRTPSKMQVENARAQVEWRGPGRPGSDDIRSDIAYQISNLADKGHNGGTSSKYLLRRLARDHPDVLKRYERGEFDSVKEAARKAGIVPEKLSRFDQIVKWIPTLNKDEKRKLLEMLKGKSEFPVCRVDREAAERGLARRPLR